ncbi:NMD3-related protein [Methanonatronarchaeum sp. AMET-Sl]|uniref:60S ribosomal export protein NMD3 n=1 Tax=Methanonatronarchaeum sp. AMET-Sl TaxID=3037654 RepID=UPI00244DF13C|nr:NMD3-related protein [Methanonatronarchaeum sp. AMET-Sl]WGI17771.1 NMD3-related protein [Methanonatronarchaeum sp. AMET-Sl]
MMFCPSCGKEISGENRLCRECFLKNVDVVKLPDFVDVDVCVKCGAHREGDTWIDHEENQKLISAEMAVMSELHVHRLVEDLDIAIALDIDSDPIQGEVTVTGTIENKPIQTTLPTTVRIRDTSCERCNKASAGYFESVVQVRRPGMELSNQEINIIHKSALKLAERERIDERMSYISDVAETDGGFDIYTGTKQLGLKISKLIKKRYGGTYTQSGTLIGEKDGQKVYRTAYSLKLPPFRKGDIITVDQKPVGITGTGRTITGIELETGDQYRSDWKHMKDKEIKRIGNLQEVDKGVISMVSENVVQVVEPIEYTNVKLKRPSFIKKMDEGTEKGVFKHNKDYLLIPEKFTKTKSKTK